LEVIVAHMGDKPLKGRAFLLAGAFVSGTPFCWEVPATPPE
jgi:hypothetical protein